jgi:hypothetical protein
MEQRILPDPPLFPVMDQWVLGESDKGDQPPQPLIPLSSRLFSLSTCDLKCNSRVLLLLGKPGLVEMLLVVGAPGRSWCIINEF